MKQKRLHSHATGEWFLAIVVVCAFAGGLLVAQTVGYHPRTYTDGLVSFSYPGSWQSLPVSALGDEAMSASVWKLLFEASRWPRGAMREATLRLERAENMVDARIALAALSGSRSELKALYAPDAIMPASVGGREGFGLRSYWAEAPASPEPVATARVERAITVGSGVYLLSVEYDPRSDAEELERIEADFSSIADSLSIGGTR